MPRMMLARHVHVAETDLKARAEAEEFLLQGFFGQRGMEIIRRTRVGFGNDPRWTGGERTPDIEERGRVFQQLTKSYDFWIDNGLALVGSLETVVQRIREQQQRVGYTVLCTQHQIGEMPRPLVQKSLRLFGEAVIPAFA
jgi:alkanesulfonate monooxygenase SsuD/methylene tetrahydromethanopterin reductase-like flavin-dependent oxidoreductase (luciferase family)